MNQLAQRWTTIRNRISTLDHGAEYWIAGKPRTYEEYKRDLLAELQSVKVAILSELEREI